MVPSYVPTLDSMMGWLPLSWASITAATSAAWSTLVLSEILLLVIAVVIVLKLFDWLHLKG